MLSPKRRKTVWGNWVCGHTTRNWIVWIDCSCPFLVRVCWLLILETHYPANQSFYKFSQWKIHNKSLYKKKKELKCNWLQLFLTKADMMFSNAMLSSWGLNVCLDKRMCPVTNKRLSNRISKQEARVDLSLIGMFYLPNKIKAALKMKSSISCLGKDDASQRQIFSCRVPKRGSQRWTGSSQRKEGEK